jgi:hypothetical protein
MIAKTAALFALTLSAGVTAYADFSYTNTQRTTGGSMGSMLGATDRVIKSSFKGQKMMTSMGDASTIIDFDAQTVTTVSDSQKTYTVKKFSDLALPAGTNMDMNVDVKETGQKKVVNGFNAREMVVTMFMDIDTGRGQSMQMQMEMDMWVSGDVPGASEIRAFYKRNAANFPWSAVMGASGNQSMAKAMAQMQRKLAEVDGVVVEQVIRIKSAGGPQSPPMAQAPQMSAAQQAQMQAAMAKMQEMAKQGGPGGAAAQQALAGMPGMAGGAAAGGGSLIEMTVDASAFSNASIPVSVFAVPAGYKPK